MVDRRRRITILHYSAPPVVGGVESVILAHARLMKTAGYAVTVVAGDGNAEALPAGVDFVKVPELSSRNPEVVKASLELEQGKVPENFGDLVSRIEFYLKPVFQTSDQVIVHNVFTKHFNLPLTAALGRLLEKGDLKGCLAWCHDFTWTSEHSLSKVFPGYPWDLLRTAHPDIVYVTISQARQKELAGLFACPIEHIKVIYNGVDPQELLGLSPLGMTLIEGLNLWNADLILLMPVRVTQAKNIELAIRLAAVLKERQMRPKLVLTGPPDPHDQNNMAYFQDLLALRHELNVEQEFRFVYESGLKAEPPLVVDMSVVGDLYRVSDALFMPSHREGFGMPILEAGLAGLAVFCTPIPAAKELGGGDVISFSPEAEPQEIANLILNWAGHNAAWRLQRRVRKELTWQNIFQQAILPLLEKGMP